MNGFNLAPNINQLLLNMMQSTSTPPLQPEKLIPPFIPQWTEQLIQTNIPVLEQLIPPQIPQWQEQYPIDTNQGFNESILIDQNELGIMNALELPDFIKRYAIRKAEHIEGNSLYHETSPENAFNLIYADQDISGLNVSNDPNFALGQKGKGIVIEMDKQSTFGDKGFSRVINKPSTPLIGEKEFELAQGTKIGKIKSILIKPNIKLPPRIKMLFNRDFLHTESKDGSIKYTPKIPINRR